MTKFHFVFAVAAVTILSIGIGSQGLRATGEDRVVFDPPVTGPVSTETGQWRRKVQQVFDGRTRTLVRRAYEVWDPEPSRDLDFVWTPDRPELDRPGRINGNGHLVWRMKGLPSYDRESGFAEYRGTMRGGRIEGRGAYLDKAGLLYEGEWRAGLMHGHGTLKLPSGDEYVGAFARGKASGVGRYIDVTGEIYDGPFVDGLRHGRGMTTLPSSARYASSWVTGEEAEASGLTRLAQSGGKSAPGGADDIRIGITIDRSKKRDYVQDLLYVARQTEQAMVIEPENARLRQLWRGRGPIQLTDSEETVRDQTGVGILSMPQGNLPPTGLVIEIQNRTATSTSVAGLVLDVKSSRPDLKPAIELSRGSFAACRIAFKYNPKEEYFRPTAEFSNYGWGPANNFAVTFNLGSNAGAGPKHRKSLGSVSRSTVISFAPELSAVGMNLNALSRLASTGFHCKALDRDECRYPGPGAKPPRHCEAIVAECLRQVRNSGFFGSLAGSIELMSEDIVLPVSGNIEYEWHDRDGSTQREMRPFNLHLRMGRLLGQPECGEGGAPEKVSSRPIELNPDRLGYKLAVSHRTTIPAGRSARLLLELQSTKTTFHDLRVVVQLANGQEVSSRNVRFDYYRPSWFRPLDF